MKRTITLIFAALMASIMIFGLTACGGPSEEQLKKMDENMVKYEKIVADAKIEMTKLSGYVDQIAGFEETYNKLEELMRQIEKQAKDIRTAYDENRTSYSTEQADKVNETLETQIETGTTFLNDLKNTVSQAEQLISAAQSDS